MNTNQYIIVFLIFTIVSCKVEMKQEIVIINPETAVEREVRLSKFTDDITYVPLDNEILFQHPNRIEVTKDHFIMATFPTGIMVFDRKGTFRNKIGAMGRGPGEYQFGLYFTIDPENELVYIYDSNRIIAFTFYGKHIHDYSLTEFETSFWDIQFINDKLYLAGRISSGHAKYDWLILYTNGSLYSYKYNHIPHFESRQGDWGGFYTISNNLYYWNNYNDTIFLIKDSLYQQSAYFAQGAFRRPHGNIPLDIARRYFRALDIIGTNAYLFFLYYFDNYLQSGYMKKNNGVLNITGKIDSYSGFDHPGILNDIDGGPAFPPFYYFQENGEEFLIGWIHAFKLKAHIESEAFKNSTPKYPEKKKELEKLAASLDENDNPVLMLVKLKK
jgi:hypothetical protein